MVRKKLDISKPLLSWYDQYRRVLPWRAAAGTKPDPYHVWLSEIMLQQTTVVTVAPYFHKFLKRWPTVQVLAKAKRSDVLRLWAGLGYYRRAHALHEAAKVVCREFGGWFPSTEDELLTLPGIGPYTSAAIAAIAFDRRANVVDGNVERVMARLFAIQKPMPKAKAELKTLAAGLVPAKRCGDYAQALMDLGATVCAPRRPKCDLCPLSFACVARVKGIAEKLPLRERKKGKPVRCGVAFYVRNERGAVLLRRRPDGGLLGGMMEIPSGSWQEDVRISFKEAVQDAPLKTDWRVLPGKVRHAFTHFDLELSVAFATISVKGHGRGAGRWVLPDRLDREALPSVMRKIVRHVRKLKEA